MANTTHEEFRLDNLPNHNTLKLILRNNLQISFLRINSNKKSQVSLSIPTLRIEPGIWFIGNQPDFIFNVGNPFPWQMIIDNASKVNGSKYFEENHLVSKSIFSRYAGILIANITTYPQTK